MAVNEYLQAAAGQLESAATALKMEMDQARADFMTFERQANHEIENRQGEIRERMVHLATAQTPAEAHVINSQIQRFRKEIDSIKDSIAKRKRQLDGMLKGKEGAMNGFMSQARSLHNQASSFK
jgi:uncharacterized protein (DUF3084 family)